MILLKLVAARNLASCAFLVCACLLLAGACQAQQKSAPAPTFSLLVSANGDVYKIDFYGDPADYAKEVPNGMRDWTQAEYLTGTLLTSIGENNCCHISAVSATLNGSPAAVSPPLLAQIFEWAYIYIQFGQPSSQQQVQEDYARLQQAVANEGVQEAGIVAGNLANLATIFGPIAEGLDKTLGSQGAKQVAQFAQLITDIVEGGPQLQQEYPNTASDVTCALQSLGLTTGPSYDPSQLITMISEKLKTSGYATQLAQTLYGAAYQGTCSTTAQPLNSAAASQTANIVTLLGQNTLQAAAGDALQAGLVFYQAYFLRGLTFETAGGAATEEGFSDVLSCELPAGIIGTTIIQAYIMPQAALLLLEVDIQNLLFSSVFPIFGSNTQPTVLVAPFEGQEVIFPNSGALAMQALGETEALESLWYQTDQQLSSYQITPVNSPSGDQQFANALANVAEQTQSILANSVTIAASIPAPPTGLTAVVH